MPPKFDSTLANVIHIGFASMAGIAAQLAVGFGTLFLGSDTAEEEKQLFRIARAVAGAVAGAAAAWVSARRQIVRGELKAPASPFTIAVCVAGAYALGAIAGPFVYGAGLSAFEAHRRRASEEAVTAFLTMALLPFALWWGLRRRRESAVDIAESVGAPAVDSGVGFDGNQFTTPLEPKQRAIVAQALADLDAIDVQFSGLHAYRGDPHALSEHAAAAFPAITACRSGFKPLLPDADAKFRHPSACMPLPHLHHVSTALGNACAAYTQAAMIPMLLADGDPGALEYIRSAATELGIVGDEPEQVVDAAVREARRQRNLAATAAGFPHNLYASLR